MGFFNGIGIFLGMLCFVVMEFLIKKGVGVYGSWWFLMWFLGMYIIFVYEYWLDKDVVILNIYRKLYDFFFNVEIIFFKNLKI